MIKTRQGGGVETYNKGIIITGKGCGLNNRGGGGVDDHRSTVVKTCRVSELLRMWQGA